MKTLDIKNIPAMSDEADETEGTTNKSGVVEEDMALECDGKNCYPKFF